MTQAGISCIRLFEQREHHRSTYNETQFNPKHSILLLKSTLPARNLSGRDESHQQYGLMSTDAKIKDFLKNVLTQIEEWLPKNELEKFSLVITNAHSKEVFECWEFHVQSKDAQENSDPNNPTSNKKLKRIQQEIGSVMRQISATASYLPLLDCICSFDILIHTIKDCEVPDHFPSVHTRLILWSTINYLHSKS